MAKLNFQSSESHDPSEIILICRFAAQISMLMHSKQSRVVSTQIWVKYGQTQMLG